MTGWKLYMKTPINNYINKYLKIRPLRLHMPGHKGIAPDEMLKFTYAYDITEISGADSLFEADGIIAESEAIASDLFNTGTTVYSCGGSTLCIQAMLYLMKQEKRTIIAARNVHQSFLNACILLDLPIKWIFPVESSGILSGIYLPSQFEEILKNTESPACVYVTSPDYLGHMADISGISDVCKKYNARLIVDNAHGSHLAFLPESLHPIALGADFCCDSAHKTLPCLTGCAYLHARESGIEQKLKEAMRIFSSTSPSYLMLDSLDLCNVYLNEKCKDDCKRLQEEIRDLKKSLNEKYCFISDDMLHLTIDVKKFDMSGIELAGEIEKRNAYLEYFDSEYVVILLSTISSKNDLNDIKNLLLDIDIHKKNADIFYNNDLAFPHPERACSVREAAMSANKIISVDDSYGKICASVKVPCPPAIPIVISGEIIDNDCIALLKHYNIKQISICT